MTTHTTKTLAVALAAAHAASPFATKDDAVLWAYKQGTTLNTAEQAYKLAKLGLTAVVVSHKADAVKWLAATYPVDQWTAKAVPGAVGALVEKFGVKPNTAKEYAKQHSENLGVDHPASSTVDSDEVIARDVENYDEYDSYEELKDALIEEFLGRGRSRSNVNEYTKGLRMHFAILAR